MYWDVRTDESMTVEVHWNSARTALLTFAQPGKTPSGPHYTNGMLTLRCAAPLVSAGTAVAQAMIKCDFWCEGIEFYGLRDDFLPLHKFPGVSTSFVRFTSPVVHTKKYGLNNIGNVDMATNTVYSNSVVGGTVPAQPPQIGITQPTPIIAAPPIDPVALAPIQANSIISLELPTVKGTSDLTAYAKVGSPGAALLYMNTSYANTTQHPMGQRTTMDTTLEPSYKLSFVAHVVDGLAKFCLVSTWPYELFNVMGQKFQTLCMMLHFITYHLGT
jgi:hypothetical protein